MSTQHNGGQAFPVPAGNYSGGESWSSDEGMSLRDYFAAKAMAAYVTKEGPASDEDGDFVAKYAYEIADAMLRERAAPPASVTHAASDLLAAARQALAMWQWDESAGGRSAREHLQSAIAKAEGR